MPAKPTPEQLRSTTDVRVVHAFIAAERLTRAELADVAGVSKPTSSESVRRLRAAGLVAPTGDSKPSAGRAADYYALAPEAPVGLAASIGPDGVIVEVVDMRGRTVTRSRTAPTPAPSGTLAAALRRTVARAVHTASGPVVAAAVSAASPTDRRTGRLTQLVYAPFPAGDLDVAAAVRTAVDGTVAVDNDVNWAAAAERAAGVAQGLDDFLYVYLGEGMGAAIVLDGQVRRGATGLSGEIGQLLTRDARHRAVALADVVGFEELRRAGSTALDVDAMRALLSSAARSSATRVRALTAAVAGAVDSAVALLDPAVVVVGGPWGSHPRVHDDLARHLAHAARPVPLRAAAIAVEPGLAGARLHTAGLVRDAVLRTVSGVGV